MTHINGLRIASYDANGNMSTRTESATYAQTFDVENRLTDVNGVRFVYDADGGLVKKIEGSKTTTYVGNIFEKEQALVFMPNTQRSFGSNWKIENFALPGGKTRKYYYFGGQRVAVRENNAAPQWIHGDHLGSASSTTDLAGVKVGEMRYKPFGEYRVDTGDAKGNKRFQGSERVASIELDSMGARFYSARFGRFISGDTIVPGAGNPHAFNRYSFVLNNPLKFVDPSGHVIEKPRQVCPDDWCNQSPYSLWLNNLYEINLNKRLDQWFREHANYRWDTDPYVSEMLPTAGIDIRGGYLSTYGGTARLKGGQQFNMLLGTTAIVAGAVGMSDPKTEKTPTDLYAFGSKSSPRSPREGKDVFPNPQGIIERQSGPFPKGASTFADPAQAPLTGPYHKLPEGTELPKGLSVIADGLDVMPQSNNPPSHHTIYPSSAMTYQEFMDKFLNLPWQYAGRK